MTDPLRLHALTLAAIRAAAPKLPNAGAWEQAMRAALTTGHTAAYLSGVAERSAGGKVRAWLAKFTLAALPKADRAKLNAAISTQLDYLSKFTSQVRGMSDAQIAARADLYGGAVRASYYGARFPGLENVPGDGQTACRTACQCSLEQTDDGIMWVLGAAEHCADCESLAKGSPYGNT